MSVLVNGLLSSWLAVAPAPAPSNAELAAEVAKLRAQVREQGDMLMQLLKDEQEHYNFLLKLLRARGTGAAPPEEGSPGSAPGKAAAVLEARPAAPSAASSPSTAVASSVATGTVRGKVSLAQGPLRDVYVYLDGVKGPAARGRTVEIVQRDKQFVPDVAVVLRGTKVAFPNYDSVFHNVFSLTPPHPFDLGSRRAGEPARPVELGTPGVVEVFCNVHSRMHASILVVPNATFVRVEPSGQFKLEGVPTGSRKLVFWSPHTKPHEELVEVKAQGAEVNVTLEAQPASAHNNKLGQPYSTYDK